MVHGSFTNSGSTNAMLRRVPVSTQLISQRSAPGRAARAVARAARDRRVLAGTAAATGAALAAGLARELLADDAEERSDQGAAFHIKGSESAAAAVARITRTRLDHALHELSDGLEEDAPRAVHEARKDLKKVRSVLRLVRDPIGKDRYRSENARLRDASRALATTRDATVRIDTLEALAERYGDELPPATKELSRALDEERSSVAGDAADSQSELGTAARRASELITQTRDEVEAWSFQKSGFKLMAAGLERSYRRGHRRFADVRSDPTPENVHEWRKRVKDLWYDLRLLRGTWPPILGEMADQAHELSDLLGDHHDLTVLAEDLDQRGEMDGDDLVTLQALIEGRQEELLEAAVPIGERLYAESPRMFVDRMRAYWRARNGG
jgi:CHAD domain-containing protein